MENMSKRFAQAVLDRRKQLKLTQEELAKKVGTTKQMVSKYELGQRSPKVAMANAFAEALETTLDELLGVEETESYSNEPKTPEARLLVKGIDKMPEEQRKAILNMMAGLYPGLFEEGTDKQ